MRKDWENNFVQSTMLLKMSTEPLYSLKILQETFSGPKQPEIYTTI